MRGDKITWPNPLIQRFEPIEISEELYLRGPRGPSGPKGLRDLNLEDVDEIEEFVSEFGWLGVNRFQTDWLPTPVKRAVAREIQDMQPLVDRELARRTFEHIEEFRYYARWLRAMTTIWLDYKAGTLANGPSQWEFEPYAPRPQSELDALLHLARDFDLLLAYDFHARIDVWERDGSLVFPETWRPSTLISAMAAQLFNHVAEDAPYRICKNETCKRLFVRKLGGAEYGQHHSEGILYCSLNCARAQAQRDFRRRKKADKREEKR